MRALNWRLPFHPGNHGLLGKPQGATREDATVKHGQRSQVQLVGMEAGWWLKSYLVACNKFEEHESWPSQQSDFFSQVSWMRDSI